MTKIIAVTPEWIPKLVPLIDAYQRFYKVNPDTKRNVDFFSKLVTQPELAVQFAALDETESPIGFVTLYFLPSSLSARTYCLLNDLFTLPAARGKGVGRALIRHCQSYAKERGFTSMEWMTQKENHTAQRLYDSLTADKSEWFLYSLNGEVR